MTKPAPKTPPVTRLHDMIVEEVSMVDKAANRRRLLLIKRDSHMPVGQEVTQRPNGTLTAGGAAPPPAQPPAAAPPPTQTTKATAALTADAQTTLGALVDQVIATLTAQKGVVDGATVVEGEDQVEAADLADALLGAAEQLEDGVYALFGIEEAPDAPAAGAPAGAAPVTGSAPASPEMVKRDLSVPMSKRLQVLGARRVLQKAAASKTGRALIEKVGARMAKKRLEKFKQAISLLSEIFGEIAPQVVEAVKAKGAPATPAAPAPVAKGAGDTALQKEVGELKKQLADVVALAKSQGAELATLRKAAPEPNGRKPQGNPAATQRKPVSWPLDMNRQPAGGNDTFF